MFSSKQFLPGTSVGTYDVSNIKLEEDIDIKEEVEVNVKNEDIDIKDEGSVYSEEHIKDEEGVYSEEEDQEDIDTREYKEVEVKEETIEYKEVEVKEEGILNEKFREQGATEQSQEIHTVERRYPCDVCIRTFKQRKLLNVHHRTHTGERP